MLTSSVALLKLRAGWSGTGATITVWPLPRPTPVAATAWPATPRGVGESRCFHEAPAPGPPSGAVVARGEVRRGDAPAIRLWLRLPAA